MDASLAMAAYAAVFNAVSGAAVGMRLWHWATVNWPSIARRASPDAACLAGAIAGAFISWVIV